MFIHIGQDTVVIDKEIIGIFDMDTATESAITRKFLGEKQKQLLVEIAAVEIPKSFILFEENGLTKVCISPLSSSALRGRLNDESN